MSDTKKIIWKNLPSYDARKAIAIDLIRKANNEGKRRVTSVKISKCGRYAKGDLLTKTQRLPTQVELPEGIGSGIEELSLRLRDTKGKVATLTFELIRTWGHARELKRSGRTYVQKADGTGPLHAGSWSEDCIAFWPVDEESSA